MMRNSGMKVLVEREWLLGKLREGLEQHQSEYDLAKARYCEMAEGRCEDLLRDLQRGQAVRIEFSKPMPIAFDEEFERIIGMLENSVDDEVQLDEEQYAAYVQGRWSWRDAFEAQTMVYNR